MGVDTRRPPLPAPTDTTSMDESSAVPTEVATNVTTRTDKSSYEIPEDGSPITISTQKITGSRDGHLGHHSRQKSQTSLLIEYFEGGKSGDKLKNRPSVRVKVTPSARKKHGHDAVRVTSIGKDNRPSYTRRISLGSSKAAETGAPEGTEISHSSESNVSAGRPPVEIEVLNNGSDLSKSSRGMTYALDSNVSSMPPDSMLEGDSMVSSERSRGLERDDESTITEGHLRAPQRTRSRSTSKERITQKVMEKLGQAPAKQRKSSRSSHDRSLEYDEQGHPRERRRRSSKSHRLDEDTVSGAESSLLSSNPTASQRSYRSGTSQGSRMTNNPRLLEMVEDTIKRMILPEINAIKEDQKTDRNYRTFEEKRRGSLPQSDYTENTLERRVSKSSSTPHLTSKPKVVLNRTGDDDGTVLSRGDSEYRRVRRSSRDGKEHRSRRSSGGHSLKSDGYDDDETVTEEVRRKSSKSDYKLRDAAAAGIIGGILTKEALKHHDSQDDVHERRKKRSKSRSSRSRSASLADTAEHSFTTTTKEDIPPMPMASHINDSEITRESILSQDTEMPGSYPEMRTPIREVSRASVDASMSPSSSRTPTRTPVQTRGLGMSHANQSIDSPNGTISTKARMAALAAAGLGGAAAAKGVEEHHHRHTNDDGYSETSSQHSVGSPVQSVSSLKKQYEDPLVPAGLRPQSAASRSSAGRLHDKQHSQASLRSSPSSPSTKLARSRQHSRNMGHDEFITPLERPDSEYMRSGTNTPNGESAEEWWERQHQVNDQYRSSLDGNEDYRNSVTTADNRMSYQTNPYPEDEKRFTTFTEDSQEYGSDKVDTAQGVRGVGANPEYVHTPFGVESAVASLMEPSFVSSGLSSQGTDSLISPAKHNGSYSDQMIEHHSAPSKHSGSYSDRMAEHLRAMGKDDPVMYEGSTLSQSMPSQSRWAQIKGHAQSMSGSTSRDDVAAVGSPKQSETRSVREEQSLRQEPSLREQPSRESPVKLGASGLPVADDPLPEIGHFDDTRSEISTNPSIIQGPLGGDPTGKETWPYSPSPRHSARHSAQEELRSRGSRDSRSVKSGHGKEAGLAAAAAGGAAVLAAKHAAKQPSVEQVYEDGRRLTPDIGRYAQDPIDREATPTSAASPAAYRDEGYVTDARERSNGALTPKAEQRRYGHNDVNEFNDAMDAQSLGEDDPFIGGAIDDAKHKRHLSGNSHGMASPLYDSSTGKGMDHIQSKDIVALMDHLTVRDAQRNARDTEILVTLVRSATEMRQNFEDIKRFIAEQDRMIMQNTDRDAEQTVKQVLGGPRPQPSSPRTPRQQSQEEIQTKRKGVLRRALKGLTGGGKNANDLGKVEDMLMQILDNVEDLKHQGIGKQPYGSYTQDSLDSYEKLRAAPDSGYEPDGQAGTSSTPSHSGHLSVTPRGEKQQFHSGYDGRRNSANRVSTVLEGDEDENLEPHETRVLDSFDHDERMLTPTQENLRRGSTPRNTPPRFQEVPNEDLTPKTAEKQRKHKSNSSSIFAGVPKISRWSKTTSSSAAPDPATLDSPKMARNQRPLSAASRSGSDLQRYDDDGYSLREDDRLRSTQSLAREQERVPSAETRSIRSQASKASRITRTPSPLIPSEASFKQRDEYDEQSQASPVQQDQEYDHEFDDPKYQAHRNSLLLQHPQPRQGPTNRHQNTLESQAQQFDGPSTGTDSDLSQRTVSDFDPAMWGSQGTASLARNRLSQAEPLSPVSMSSPYTGKAKDDAPLIPQQNHHQQQPQAAPKINYDQYDDEDDYEPQYSNSGFAKPAPGRVNYSSPYGSGHLLEPIEEVRYSLETDRSVSRARNRSSKPSSRCR